MAYSSKKAAVKKYGHVKPAAKMKGPLLMRKCGSKRYVGK